MLKNKNYFLIIQIVFLVLIFNFTSFSQKTDQQRQAEHQIVIDYLNSLYQNSPINSNTDESLSKENADKTLRKIAGEEDRKSYIMNGNNVLCQVWNYGGICAGLGGEGLRERLDLVWRDLPYIFQFSPFVGASVPDAKNSNKRLHIISDGMYDYSNIGLRDENLTTFFKWTWQPLPGYADPDQEFMASNPAFDANRDGKPDSWPRSWYSEALGE
ncbi:MAG TPA: hypothetical protein PKD67_13130, partial [Ignavibacteriaceae bacterium]|nr:hypothetical protein [Ignavibacteriaceae bacterium]